MQLSANSRRLTDESGIAMLTLIGVMMILALVTAGIMSSVQTDTVQARRDQDRKIAYSAAEAGISNYMFRLQSDPHAWTRCTSVPGTAFVSQAWAGTGADPRAWRGLTGTTSQYAVELLPKPGQSTCNTADPVGSMIDRGVLRIRSTGRSRGVKRSVVTKFKRESFLDYMWFTHIESSDPVWYTLGVGGAPTSTTVALGGQTVDAWAAANCGWYRDGRSSRRYNGYWFDASNNPIAFTRSCDEIRFAAADRIRGPMHTNDEFLICDGAQLGRDVNDAIEVSSPPQGWRACSGAGIPPTPGTFSTNQNVLTMPPANTGMRAQALPEYIFTGRTTIVLSASGITVNGTAMPYPENGLIYVQNGACGETYKPYDAYNTAAGCADVYVRGSYGADLTIASARDIIVNGNVTKSGDTMLGLIANDFVRVYHPVSGLNAAASTCTNAAGSMNGVTIEAAMLALNHSVMVDNYFCGNALGSLTIRGAIVQKYRGAVGRTSGSSVVNGYAKDYYYDDRLKYREPPHFLDPVQSSWRILSQTEQVPAR